MSSDDPSAANDALRRRADQAEARARDLAVVNAFAATLLQDQSDIDDILWDVANQAVAHLALEDCVIYLRDGDALVQRAAFGPKNPKGREILAPIVIPVGRGIVGSVAATGRPERIADTRLDPRYICDDQSRAAELAVPILSKGAVIGVIDSEHSRPGFFTAWHQDLFTTLANMAASRIVRARLDEALRALNAQLEDKVARRAAELAQAHERSERLLLNVLPAPIATRLKAGETRIADRMDPVAVLFADVVGFTRFAASAEPERVVALLEDLFNTFEQIAAAAGAEKVKTIGDAILFAVGLPAPDPDPAGRACDLALQLRDAVPTIRRRTHTALEVRIGLHAGPVVAGVIGQNKFAYDLWGDTVNIAARLESHGAPGRVHVAASLARGLAGRFTFTDPVPTALEGLGVVETCFLVGATSSRRRQG